MPRFGAAYLPAFDLDTLQQGCFHPVFPRVSWREASAAAAGCDRASDAPPTGLPIPIAIQLR